MARPLCLGKLRAALAHVGSSRRLLHSFPPPFESIFNKAACYQDRLALVDSEGAYTYSNLLAGSSSLQAHFDDLLKGSSKERISFLCPNGVSYVITQWACWLGGHVAVPLYWGHPRSVLEYYIKDSQSALLVSTKAYADSLHPIAKELDLPLVVIDEVPKTETFAASKQVSRVSPESHPRVESCHTCCLIAESRGVEAPEAQGCPDSLHEWNHGSPKGRRYYAQQPFCASVGHSQCVGNLPDGRTVAHTAPASYARNCECPGRPFVCSL